MNLVRAAVNADSVLVQIGLLNTSDGTRYHLETSTESWEDKNK